MTPVKKSTLPENVTPPKNVTPPEKWIQFNV